MILGLCGSLRRGSHNHALLEAARGALPAGMRLEIFDGLAGIPAYSADDAAPAPVRAFREAIGAADAVLVATPEYNSSVPGALKNALDWASRPFPDNALRGKPAAVVGASTGLFGAVWAQAELRKVLASIGARVLDEELPVAQAHEAFDADSRLRNPQARARLAEIVAALLAEAGATLVRSA